MHHVPITTFGGRPVTAALIAAHRAADAPAPCPAIDKWAVLAACRDARAALGLSDRTLGVLAALLSFLPARDLEDGKPLVVFPSNASLSDRAHGMPESTLRRHLSALVEAGLILRRDSPNGKRYCRRGRDGVAAQAFGFDLRPLLVRADEIGAVAAEARAAREGLAAARGRLALLLREAGGLLAFVRAEGEAPAGAAEELQRLRVAFRRRLDPAALAALTGSALSLLDRLRADLLPSPEPGASAAHSGRHHPDSEIEHLESEEGREVVARPAPRRSTKPQGGTSAPDITLADVRNACPDLLPHVRGRLSDWRDLVAAASELHAQMGIARSTWEAAKAAMGPPAAAATLAAMLQRYSRIANPGAYLRALTARARRDAFSPGPMIRALLRVAPDGMRCGS